MGLQARGRLEFIERCTVLIAQEREALPILLFFAVFTVVVPEFAVLFMRWNSVVLNSAVIAVFAPPQAPRVARRVSGQGTELRIPLPCTAMLPVRPKSSGKTALVKIFCRFSLGIIPPQDRSSQSRP